MVRYKYNSVNLKDFMTLTLENCIYYIGARNNIVEQYYTHFDIILPNNYAKSKHLLMAYIHPAEHTTIQHL